MLHDIGVVEHHPIPTAPGLREVFAFPNMIRQLPGRESDIECMLYSRSRVLEARAIEKLGDNGIEVTRVQCLSRSFSGVEVAGVYLGYEVLDRELCRSYQRICASLFEISA